MAYLLRYYKEIEQKDGTIIRLEIHKKQTSDAGWVAVEIGPVLQGLSLEIQGQQGDIDTPIVKTSLSMTFVDASDLETGKKTGFWEEFYTPDALLWKVILKGKKAEETTFSTMWGGYVTPDSYSESLVYRGSVNIIARDNIGHLQDFPFDGMANDDGMMSVFDIFASAWAKIESPMDLDFGTSGEWLFSEGVITYDMMVNVSTFENKDWYEVVESLLYSLGLVMRYIGDGLVKVCPLRFMPCQGRASIDVVPHIEPVFVAGATRDLVPAVRRIEETHSYELKSEMRMPQVDADDFTGEVETLDLSTSAGSVFNLHYWRIHNETRGQGWVDGGKPIYFNPRGYNISEIEESKDQDFMWLTSSAYIAGLNRYAEYSRYITASRLTMNLEIGPVHSLSLGGGTTLKRVGSSATYPTSIALAVYVESNGVTSWLNKDGEWVSSEAMVTYGLDNGRMSLVLPVDSFVDKVMIGVRIYYLSSTWDLDMYTPLYTLSFVDNRTLLETARVNTNYKDENNVVLTRDPKLAPAMDRVALPAVIENGIFAKVGDYVKAARLWNWADSSQQQMAVWNHLSLLSYYAKPNNQISGTIVNADMIRIAAIYVWHGKEHILTSGRYNYLTGHIDSAVLREFARYTDMWSEMPGAELPATDESTKNNIESGSASSASSGATYTSTQTVNIGTGGGGGTGASNLGDLQDVNVDSVTAQSVLWYNGTSWVGLSKSSLLSGYVTEAKLATSIQDVNTAIGLKVDKTYVDAEFAKYLLKEAISQTIKGDIRIEGNFVVTGDTASGGEGSSDVNVGINEEQLKEYLDANKYVTEVWIAEQRYVTLATYATGIGQLGNRITTIENSYVTGSTLASYALKSEIPTTLPASDVYAWAKKSSLALADVPDLSSKYLPLSGGTISGTSSSPLKINTSSTTIGIPLNVSNVNKSWIGWSAGQGVYLWNAASNKYLGIKEDGTPYYDSNTLIHSGNIGSQTVSAAKKLVTSGGADAVTVDSSGNVGIGTTLPAYKLDVNGRMQVQHASNPFLKLTSDTYNAFIQLLSTGDVAIGKSSALGLHIAQNGAVSTDYGITAKTLTIGSTAGEAHIMFMRESASYITAPALGTINFVMGGKAVSLANSVLKIKDGSVEVNGNLIVTGDTAVA